MGRKRSGNPQIGVCVCPLCGDGGASVHEQSKSTVNNFMYYFCDNCGCIQPTRTERGQQAIKDTFEPIGGEYVPDWYLAVAVPAPVPEPVPEPVPAPVPEPVPAPEFLAPKQKGWLDDE